MRVERAKAERLIRQFVVYAGVGAFGTATQYLLLVILVQVAGLNAVLASAMGFVCGAFVNYTLNYRFTFASSKRHLDAAPKFFSVALVGLGMNTLLMALGVGILRLNYLLAQIGATGTVLIQNFLLNRSWTFAVPDADEAAVDDLPPAGAPKDP